MALAESLNCNSQLAIKQSPTNFLTYDGIVPVVGDIGRSIQIAFLCIPVAEGLLGLLSNYMKFIKRQHMYVSSTKFYRAYQNKVL